MMPFLLLLSGAALSAAAPSPPDSSLALVPTLLQARTFARSAGDVVWPGYGSAPFGFLLLDADKETLLCQPGTPSGFQAEPQDPATGCARWSRARGQLPGRLLAAMPVLGPPSTIVMGTPAATGRSEGSWLRTILHEHFHQWQVSLPRYYERVSALELAGEDQTGMWMLNYRFPYAAPAVGAAYRNAASLLAQALDRRGQPSFAMHFDKYLAARAAFERSVRPQDWRYFEFQLWQEGTARWTEIQLGKAYPNPSVREAAAELEQATLRALRNADLKEAGREVVYPFGAAEAMLMSACGPGWRAAYPAVLAHGPLLATARKACRS